LRTRVMGVRSGVRSCGWRTVGIGYKDRGTWVVLGKAKAASVDARIKIREEVVELSKNSTGSARQWSRIW
jgi:hypothetical protein